MKNRRRAKLCLLLSAVIVTAGAVPQLILPADAKKFNKSTVDPADDNLHQGILLMRKGNYEGAIDSFKQAAYFSRNQYNPTAYQYLGLCYKAVRNYPLAVEAFTKFFQQNTDPAPDVHIDFAEVYLDLHEIEKARKEINLAASEGSGQNWRRKYAMGELEEKASADEKTGSNHLSQAEDWYNAAIEIKPNCTECWMGKGRVEVKMARYVPAIKTYRTILDRGALMHPNLEELYYNMGTCLLKRGDHQGALDHWRMALEQNPESYDAHVALGSLLDEEHHFSSAVKEYQAAVSCAPKDSDQSQLMRRIQYLEQQLQPKVEPAMIKPSPSMRQQYDESMQQQNPAPVVNTAPPKDAGF